MATLFRKVNKDITTCGGARFTVLWGKKDMMPGDILSALATRTCTPIRLALVLGSSWAIEQRSNPRQAIPWTLLSDDECDVTPLDLLVQSVMVCCGKCG